MPDNELTYEIVQFMNILEMSVGNNYCQNE